MKYKLIIFVILLILFTLTGCCFSIGLPVTDGTTIKETVTTEAISSESTSTETTPTETTAVETTSDSSSETTAIETTSDSSAETTAAETTAETDIQEDVNRAPNVGEITISNPNPVTNTTYAISVLASDPDGDLLTYNWSVNAGSLTSRITDPTNWKTPQGAGEYTINLAVSDGKGHVASKTKKISVVLAPQPIIIKDIVFPDKIYVNNPNVVTAILSDPSQEGNVVWSWNVGNNGDVIVRGVNSKMAWIPDREGQNDVTVTIKNEKGVTLSTRTETALVVPVPIVSLGVNKVAAEGGFIELDGAVYAGGNLYAGDSNNNKRCTGLISFDITGLAGANIQSAEVSFLISKGWGNPLDFSEYLSLTTYYWGPRAIRHGDDTAGGDVLQTLEPATFACFNDELKDALQDAVDAGRPRFQLRIHFAGGSNTDEDNNWDGWEYPQNNIKLIITYVQ